MPTVTVGDTDIVYHQSGEGPDIVWISGGGGNGAPWRICQTPAFDDAYRSTSVRQPRRRRDGLPRAGALDGRGSRQADAAALIEAVCNPPSPSSASRWARSRCSSSPLIAQI